MQVSFEAGLISRCVKVSARDASAVKETKPIALEAKTSPLKVAVFPDGLGPTVTLQAQGYSDEACTLLTQEVSETREGTFSSPPAVVKLTLSAALKADAGVDQDRDGFPLPADCDDTDPFINPGLTEVCTDGFDNDCDNRIDCAQGSCLGSACAGGGICTVSGQNTVCFAATEVLCNDGLDNDNNALIDCLDPACTVGTACTDGNSCTTGDRCVSDGGCEKTTDTLCTTPPAAQCYAAAGVCLPDAGPTCQYTQVAGNCNDGLACTDADTCSSGTCAGMPRTCTTPGNACLMPSGACQEPGGTCTYPPLAAGTGTCSDGQSCTLNDTCNGDGGCAGTPVTCAPPSQCQNASTTCDTAGTCLYTARSGACDAGTGAAGTCDLNFNCNAAPTTLFATPPSNFGEGQLPDDAGSPFTVSCPTTINTSTQVITSICLPAMPPNVVITQDGGVEGALLIRVPSLTVNANEVLIITGTRPIIFAVTGNVQINGTIRANNAGSPSGCGNGGNGGVVSGEGGGGGGGFGTSGALGGIRSSAGAGALGGANGSAALTPLRGGCRGGSGNGTGGGGTGGGAIQIVASGNLTVSGTGVITAPGQGGGGGTGGDDSGGGGGAGGAILLEATIVTLQAASWLSANGGAGGGGEDNGTDGLPGTAGAETSTTPAPGGTAVPNAGAGGTGATRSTVAQAGFATTDNDGAGGGGAGLGRVRLNARTSCSIDAASNRTPNVTSNGAQNCP